MPIGKLDSRQRAVRFRRGLVALVLLGFVLRLWVCAELSQHPSVGNPWRGTDMATYRRLATQILQGEWPESFYYQPFYYSVFLPIAYGVSGSSTWAVMLAQAMLGAATVWFTGVAAGTLFGYWAGLTAAGLLTLSRFHIFYTPFLLMAVLQSFWTMLLVVCVLRAYRGTGLWRWAAAALASSVAILTRGNALLFVPGILALLCWRMRREPKRLLAAMLLFGVVTCLPQLPFALRNWHHYGRWTGPSSAQDAVLALGNTPEAPPGGLAYPRSYEVWMARASLPAEDRVPVSRQILEWFRREPMAVVELKFRTFLLFWDRREIPNNVSIAQEGRRSLVLNLPVLLGFWAIGTLGLFGMFTTWRLRSPGRLFLYVTVGAYCFGTVLFYMLARFRVPLVPLLCVFGGAGVQRVVVLGRAWRLKRLGRERVLQHALAFCLSLFFVFGAFSLYQARIERHLVRWARPDGVACESADSVLLYDHGPVSCGGWRFMVIPPGGMQLRKYFSFAPAIALPAESVPARVRIPLQGEPGSRAEVAIAQGDGTWSVSTFTLADGQGVTWCEQPVLGLRLEGRRVGVDVRLRPVSGRIYLGLDLHRSYGRTSLTREPGGELTPAVDLEAALELEWPAPTSDADIGK